MAFIREYGMALVLFLVLDGIWLSVAGPAFYFQELGSLMRDKPNFFVAGVFYLVYVAALTLLVVEPAIQTGTWRTAFLMGAVMGIAAYGTYDITNLSTIKGFTAKVAMVDLAWGTLLTAGVSAITVYFLKSA